jgi:6-phosphogluconolactonase/glucosamine-6-phosphate isomerase/deaminase
VEYIYQPAETWIGKQALIDALTLALEKHSRVLWLVPGGSNISIATEVMQVLPEAFTPKLHIMLTDERYGEVGHPDSNFWQLQEAGFEPKQATFIPTLKMGLSLTQTAQTCAENFLKESKEAGFIIGQFGIGPDGHIAGILPHSPASTSTNLCEGYHTEQFDRLTLTFLALKHIDTAYAFVYGQTKKTALERLKQATADLVDQPCQILRHIPEAYIYNDCIA